MSEFINTIDLLGDTAVFKSIADRSITEFKDNRVTSLINWAFNDCKNLTNVDLPELTGYCDGAFRNCSNLVSINIPKLKALKAKYFEGCNSLEKAYFPNVTELSIYAFNRCGNLKIAEFGHLTFGERFVFADCPKLIAFVSRYEPPTDVSYSFFLDGPMVDGTGYIYVPRDQIDAYKSATNWSQFAEQYRAVEDYTVDGTLWGDLDEAKILGG